MKIMSLSGVIPLLFVVAYLCVPISSVDPRDPRFSIFQIIKFENSPCVGGTRNGTCFTTAECEDAGGEKDGECADGFGVCCVTQLTAGSSTSLNQSYIVQAASSALASGAYQYSICPCSADVCRIRFDFTKFSLASPFTVGTNTAADAALTGLGQGNAIGDCITDQFSITGPSGGSPVICGTNEGQHMYVDSDGSQCSTVNIGIGGGTTSREFDIMVTQYRCGAEMGGPPGCLQWFTAESGNVRSFNFPQQDPGATVGGTVTHLSNQHYTSCIRQPAAKTSICYIACTFVAGTDGVPAAAQGSFGVSKSENAAAKAYAGTDCSDDYISIPGATSSTILAISNTIARSGNRLCGRYLSTNREDIFTTPLLSICTTNTPFIVGVNFDEDEVATANTDATTHEAATVPGGILGFSLCYTTLA